MITCPIILKYLEASVVRESAQKRNIARSLKMYLRMYSSQVMQVFCWCGAATQRGSRPPRS
jgi:hypothetical protein